MYASPNLPQSSTFVALLRGRASQQPRQTAYTFLIDGEEEASHLSYEELDRRARMIGAKLQSLNLQGERALLLYPPGLEYITAFFACLYAGVVAVPAYPPRPNQTLVRFQAVAADAKAKIVLTTKSLLSSMERQLGQFPNLKTLSWLVTDDLDDDEGLADAWQEVTLSGDTLAFLQYTSGSTMSPRGVMLTHNNLLHNSQQINQRFGNTSETRGMIWLPPYHDMGLIGGILQPLYIGHHVTLMSPYAFLQRPFRWLQAITRTRAMISGGPNFAYELCVRRITQDQLATLDLSCWKLAFNGAEPVSADTLERFAATFEPCGFRRDALYPCYGLAEGTLIVSGGRRGSPPVIRTFDSSALKSNKVMASPGWGKKSRKLVGCGQTLADQEIVIVDPESLAKSEPDRIGEIWVAGPSVAQGYWNRPEETQQTFQAHLANTGGEPFLRTGDLGFIYDGELFIAGRLKDLIVIRGLNHHPHDIELTVEQSHPALRPGCGAAFSLEVDGEEQLVLVQEVDRRHARPLNADEVIEAIRQAIMEHYQLRVHAVVLIKHGSIPKTSSGKVKRHACRTSFLDGSLATLGMRTQKSVESETPPASLIIEPEEQTEPAPPEETRIKAIQDWLIDRIAEELKVDPKSIDIREPFVRYSFDSISTTNITSNLQDWLSLPGKMEGLTGRGLSLNLLWEYPTIEKLAQYLSRQESAEPKPADEILPEYYNFELFPEYLNLKNLMQAVETNGGGNPYFKLNEQISGSTTYINGQQCINFSAYNYLGMNGDPEVSQAAKDAIERYGTSVSASRVASGERLLHRELEQEIAGLVGTESCIVYIGGHTANVTTIGTLFKPNDLILYDALIHSSILQGSALSGAHNIPFPHNDWQALDRLLSEQRCHYKRVLIVLEGVYSTDGDIPNLPKFIEIKKRHKAFLMIDEAHSIGVLGENGRGIGEYFGVQPAEVDLWMGTLSKSFASCGGYIAGSQAVVEYLKYSASGFIYSVGISPPNAAAALTSVRKLKAEPQRVRALQHRAKLFLDLACRQGLNNGMCKDSPVVPVIVGDSFQCIQLSLALLKRGINVQPLIYPAVEDKSARLRFFISYLHTEEQVRFTVDAVAEEFAKIAPTAQGV